ncbi:hypothetical protein GF415_02470 [Candidatus Micrarchaeota archaeon]|nr:hypothetical protein [Candidatus Micrarchaeota archaeon]
MRNSFGKKGGGEALRNRVSETNGKITKAIARYKKIDPGKEQIVWLMTLRGMENANPSLKGHGENLSLSWSRENCFEVNLFDQKNRRGRKIVTSPDVLGYTPVVGSLRNMATRENYETVFCRNSLLMESQKNMALLMTGQNYFESLENAMTADPGLVRKLEGSGAEGVLKGAIYGGAIGGAIAGSSSAIFDIHSAFVAGFAGIAAFVFGAMKYAKHKKRIKNIELACILGEEVSASAKKIADAIEYSSRELVKLNRELERKETWAVQEELNSQEP